MTTTPQTASPRDPFEAAHTCFAELIAWLSLGAHDDDHVVLETGLRTRGNELLRLAYQAHLDQRFEREHSSLDTLPTVGRVVRVRSRHLVTLFGRVQVRRVSTAMRPVSVRVATDRSARAARLRGLAKTLAMPADAALSLPVQSYSAPLSEQAILNVLDGSYDHAGEQVDRQTAGHVPHRQMIELVTRAAQDTAAFYAQCTVITPANDTLSGESLEVMSVDATGVRMRPEGLREPTRKLAEQQAQRALKGDPMAQRQARSHTSRMAVVTANWEQESLVRMPEDILRDLTAPETRQPSRDHTAREARRSPASPLRWAAAPNAGTSERSRVAPQQRRRGLRVVSHGARLKSLEGRFNH